jgi:hypothetical protein
MALKNEATLAPPTAADGMGGAVGRLVSLALAHGAPVDEVGRAMSGRPMVASEDCPDCGRTLVRQEGCAKCPCGYSRC